MNEVYMPINPLIDPTLFLLVPMVGALVVAGGLVLYRLGHAHDRHSAASPAQDSRPPAGRAPSTVTVDDIMEAAGISRRLVAVWIDLGLLPMPRRVPIGSHFANCFPRWAIERARFVMEKRAAGFTYEEVRAMLDGDDDPPPQADAAAMRS